MASFSVDEVSRECVLEMLRLEDRWRKSDTMQELYDRTRHLLSDQVERYIQRNVLKAFGFAPSVENLSQFWTIRAKYEGDQVRTADLPAQGIVVLASHMRLCHTYTQEIMSSVIYLRYAHLLHDCSIPVGSAPPDATLVALDDARPTTLSNYWKTNEKLVVMAGSMT